MTIAQSKFNNRYSNSRLLLKAAFLTVVILLPAKNIVAQGSSSETITLNLKNVDIYSLIETVSIHTGKNFIVDPRVKGTVSVVSSEPVNADKLYELFLTVLEVNGFTAVQASSFTKIVPSSVGVQSAVPIVSESTETTGELVSRVIYLENTSALQILKTLTPMLSEPANLTAQSTGNAIVVTDHAANIEKLIELIILMDGQ